MTTPTRSAAAPPGLPAPVTAGVGASLRRPDGAAKVKGEFAYSSDMWIEGKIWGVTLRSPHPYARIRSVDIGPALAMPGVYAVLTHEDVPGRKLYGLEIVDQPVLAVDTVRYHGEPVALVAADHPEIARQATKAIRVDYDVYQPITDARQALGHPRWPPGRTPAPATRPPTPGRPLATRDGIRCTTRPVRSASCRGNGRPCTR